MDKFTEADKLLHEIYRQVPKWGAMYARTNTSVGLYLASQTIAKIMNYCENISPEKES